MNGAERKRGKKYGKNEGRSGKVSFVRFVSLVGAEEREGRTHGDRLIQMQEPGDGRQVEVGFVNEVTDSRNQGGRKGPWARGPRRCSIYLAY